MKYVICGTGRSGTTYIADLLTKVGMPTLHEKHWAHVGCVATPSDVATQQWDHPDFLGEATAQVAPYLPLPGVKTWHQVRHPLDTIGSFIGPFQLWGQVHAQDHEGKGCYHISHNFEETGNGLLDGIRFYVDWNLRCETGNSYRRWRLEDVDENLLLSLGAEVGLDLSKTLVREALEEIETNVNTMGEHRRPKLPDHPASEALRKMAKRYGYDDV